MTRHNREGPGEHAPVKQVLTPEGTRPSQFTGVRRILVVDDDRAVREVLHQWLAEAGFEVASVGNGVEALALEQREAGGWVILLDLLMPRMDGWAVLHQLQGSSVLQDQKVVLMSASWMLAQEGPPWRSPQVVAAIPKPFDPAQVLALLTRLVDTPSGKEQQE